MEINIDKFVGDCINATAEKIKNLKTLNIVVAGKTGVGKSTLINGVFRENLAETGIGKPVTQRMCKISKKDFPLIIYDTRGLELGQDVQKEVKKEIIDTIEQGVLSKDINQMVHCIWYCVSTPSHKFEDEEANWLKELSAENQKYDVPIIIILTQSYAKNDTEKLRNYIAQKNLNVIQVIPVLALDYEIDEEYIVKAYGLDRLIKVMSEALPDELQDTLQNVQKASLEEKKRLAHAAVAAATTAAAAECAIPVPLADAAMLIPTQVTMIASITAAFGLDISKSVLTGFVSSVLGTSGVTIAGKTIVANLLKMIPGVGTVVGSTISAATAGVLTTALGEAYILLMEAIYKGEMKANEINTDEGKAKMKSLFKEQMKGNKKIK